MRGVASPIWGSGVLLLAALSLVACNSSTSVATSTAPPNTYVGPAVGSGFTFAIDRTASTFVQQAYLPTSGYEEYVFNSGDFTALPNGILNIGVTYGNGTVGNGTVFNPPQTINWALEWPGQGGFAGLKGQIVSPFAPNQTCPSIAAPQTFQFVTFPNVGDGAGTAYGSVSISASGGTVSFANDTQFNISSGASSNPSPASASGTCGPTAFGQTVSVPNTDTVTDPGNGQSQTPSATIAIGPTGFLVEGNGFTLQKSVATYQNLLGAGLGAVGLPQPSSPLTVSGLLGAQYAGFIYGTGAAAIPARGFSAVAPASLVASFGYPNVQTACPTPPAPQTSTILYGGEFSNNDPSSNSFGNCDFAVDLGLQSAKNNGLFPNATIWVGSSFPGNKTGGSYSFSAVAVAAQLQGKYAIFLIGLDTAGLKVVSQGLQSQDWGVYLLQSN
jgi:hypothetical protein